jgi:hypothetical protein
VNIEGRLLVRQCCKVVGVLVDEIRESSEK